MPNWPLYAAWNGPIVMIGFGSIGRGTLPLVLRHFDLDRNRITVIDPDGSNAHLVEKEGIAFIKKAVTRQNYRSFLTPLLTAGPGPAFIVNLSVDVSSIDIQKLAQSLGALYIDTVIEPWPGFYFNAKLGSETRTNYAPREEMLALKARYPGGHTSIQLQTLVATAATTGSAFGAPRVTSVFGSVRQLAVLASLPSAPAVPTA